APPGGSVGQVGKRGAAGGAPVALPVGGRDLPGVPRSPAAAGARPAHHDHPAGVRAGPVVAASPAQPDRRADQGGAAVPEGHHRHERPVPPPAVAAPAAKKIASPSVTPTRSPSATARAAVPTRGGA